MNAWLLTFNTQYTLDAFLEIADLLNPTSRTLSNASWAAVGGRFMPAPSRLTKITVKNQNFFFDFLKLYNELGKVKFFQVSIIWFRGCNSSFSLGGALNAPPVADRVNTKPISKPYRTYLPKLLLVKFLTTPLLHFFLFFTELFCILSTEGDRWQFDPLRRL